MSSIENLREPISSELLKVLKKEHFTDKAIVKVDAGSAKGDNYLGEILRVVVTEDDRELKLILKVPHNDARREHLHSDLLFEKEGGFYMTSLPLLKKFQEDRKIAKIFDSTAKCYSGSVEAIIMEDLGQYGYKMADRMKGLQYEESKLALTELAKFHALSFAMRDQDPVMYQSLSNVLNEKSIDKLWEQSSTQEQFRALALGTENMIQDANHKQKYKVFSETFVETMVYLTQNKDDADYACLNHGDCWVNNMLFKYSEDNPSQPVSLKFLDFQILRLGSPVLDLSYLIFCSTTKALRQPYLDELLDLYLETLHSSMKELGSDPEKLYPKQIFEQHLKKYMKFGLIMAVMTIPIFTAPKDDIPEMDFGSQEQEGMKKLRESYALLRENHIAKERMNDIVADMVEGNFI